ncbi:MBL fold metallo-hydrolase [Kribbella sp. NBC_01245]|uniref:ComEC/Rec2 family competence protein n=1 Tax=Kribbella sp. NBC_01245 TaxID=2903578 RepID=UPI002E2CBE25|nr:MBL fold metallo-hydrolase [Kribbella sp. NBC_01245]
MDESRDDRLTVELLPARHGDAILLTWGGAAERHRMLVDAGPAWAYKDVSARMREVAAEGKLDLLVLTHVDADHVEGTIKLVNDADLPLQIDQVWHNSWDQLGDYLDAVHGEILSAIIKRRGIDWNKAFGGDAVVAPPDAPLPVDKLPGGLRLTLLAPAPEELNRLAEVWVETCREEGLDLQTLESEEGALAAFAKRSRRLHTPGDEWLGPEELDPDQLAADRTGTDRSVANASSIVLLAEYKGVRVLLAGDATPGELIPAVRRLIAERGDGADVFPLDAFKLPHHGSQNNLTAELIGLLPARHYLVSSNGSYFGHPDAPAIATVVKGAPDGAELVFNYDTEFTKPWDDECLRSRFGYRTRYRGDGELSIEVAMTSEPVA